MMKVVIGWDSLILILGAGVGVGVGDGIGDVEISCLIFITGRVERRFTLRGVLVLDVGCWVGGVYMLICLFHWHGVDDMESLGQSRYISAYFR